MGDDTDLASEVTGAESQVSSALAAEQGERLKVVRLSVDANPAATRAYEVLSMPTCMVFRDGEPLRSVVGARPERRLLEELAEVIRAAVPHRYRTRKNPRVIASRGFLCVYSLTCDFNCGKSQ